MKAKKLLLLAILSGFITTILFYVFINQSGSATVSEADMIKKVQVVAAAEDLTADQQITSDMLTYKEMPEDQVHTDAVMNKEQVIDHYTTSAIKQGEVMMNHRVQLIEEEKEVISRKIQEGYRAVSISVDYVTGVSNLIQPGDHVDVVLSSPDPDPVVTEVILERVHVLAVGERMHEQKEDGTEEYYQAVTLELTQEDTAEITHASKTGAIQLALYSKSEPIEEVNEEPLPKKNRKKQIKPSVPLLNQI